MGDFDINDSIDTDFSESDSFGSLDSSLDVTDSMDAVEITGDDSFIIDNFEANTFDDDESAEMMEPIEVDEVSDSMNDIEVEAVTFDDDNLEEMQEDYVIDNEVIDDNLDMQIDDELESDSIASMDEIDPIPAEFDEDENNSFDFDSEQETSQIDESIDSIDKIQEQLETEQEDVEEIEEVYDVAPNSDIEMLQENENIESSENNQEQMESGAEDVEEIEEVRDTTPNTDVELVQEDGNVGSSENNQEQMESDSEDEEKIEEYDATSNSDIEIVQEDGNVGSLENTQEQMEFDSEDVEEIEEEYDTIPNSDTEIVQEDRNVGSSENIQEQMESDSEDGEEIEEVDDTTPNSDVEIVQEDRNVESQDNIQEQFDGGSEEIESSEYVGEGINTAEMQEEIDSNEALSSMSEYMSAHNYGREDYETYSKDPEWQELNRDLQVAKGIEPTEYDEEIDSNEALSSMSEYMRAHNYGREDYELYSKDPEWQELNRDLQIANGIEPLGYSELTPETDNIMLETNENNSDMQSAIYSEFEQSVMERNPEFYESGSFYQQGINEFGYQGTCGPTSQANAINELLGTNELNENKVLSLAIENNLCQTQGDLDGCGGTSTEQFMELYDKMNEQVGGRFDTQLFEYGNVLDSNQVADRLDNGNVVNVAVDACALWDKSRDYVNELGVRQDDFYSDHWITVTGVDRMDSGAIKGFDIIDSGGGESYVSLEKYNDMCFGTDEHKVIDPTCIVLSRKTPEDNISDDSIFTNKLDLGHDSTGTRIVTSELEKKPSWFERIFRMKDQLSKVNK